MPGPSVCGDGGLWVVKPVADRYKNKNAATGSINFPSQLLIVPSNSRDLQTPGGRYRQRLTTRYHRDSKPQPCGHTANTKQNPTSSGLQPPLTRASPKVKPARYNRSPSLQINLYLTQGACTRQDLLLHRHYIKTLPQSWPPI